MDPTWRLDRIHLGESMLAEREILRRTRRLELVKPRTIKVYEAKQLPKHEVRNSRNVVEAGPNAPQLKRLIQHPYKEDTTHPRPGPSWRQPLNTKLEVIPFGTEKRAAFVEGARPRWPRATRVVSGPQARPRPSLSAFLETGVER
jgi:hypothetical protein